MLAFTGIPHGAKFSKPVKITYYYEEEDIPLTIREEDIRFGYYDDYLGVWIGLPTEVDTIKNKLTVEINHFTPQGTVINCDGSGATKIWTIESEEEQITQKCNPCTGWEIGSDTLELKTYQDITIEGETLKQLGSKEGVVTCEEKEKDIVKMHIASECPEGYERSGFEECSKTVTYYAYDSVQSLKGRKIYEIKFEELGDSCILVDESESEPNIEKILNAIEFKALCGYDHCEIEESEITFENNVLTFNLYAENRLTEGPAVSACIFAYPQVTYTGTGTREVNTIPVCEEEGERSFNDKGECQICACDHKKGGPQNIEEEICTWTSFTDCNTEETCPINYENNVDPRPDGCYVCKDGKWVEEEESLCEEVCSDDAQEEEIIDSIGSEPVPYVIKDITGMTGNSNNNNYRCNDLPDKETETDDTLITSGGGTGGGSTDDGTSGGTSRTNTRNEERKKVCPEGDDKQTEYPKCPEGFEQNYKEKVIMVKEGNIDTRDLKFCDSFRDFPDHIDNLDRNTELKIYDSALRKSQCWLLVEAQKELDGVKPDFYVKLNQVIDFIQSPETNKQTPSLTNLTNESQTNESVYLTWDIVPEAEFYIIYREGNIIEDVTEANYNDTNLKAEKEYVYYVTAYNSTFEIAESGFSNNVTTKTYENVNVSVKDKIQLIEFYNTSQNNESIYFNWTVKGNYSYSELFRESNLVYNDTLTEYNDTNLQSNTSYFYEFFARWNSTLFEYINKTFNTTS